MLTVGLFQSMLNVTPRFIGLDMETMTLGSIRVLGLSEMIVTVTVGGVDHTDFTQDNITFEVKIFLRLRNITA